MPTRRTLSPLSLSDRLPGYAAALLVFVPGIAGAHHAEFMQDRPFLQGLSMPAHGLDHLLAALAAGVLAARMNSRSGWTLALSVGGAGLLAGLLNLGGITLPECTLCAVLAGVGVLLLRPRSLLAPVVAVGIALLFATNVMALSEMAPAPGGSLAAFTGGCSIAMALLINAGFLTGRLLQKHPRAADLWTGGALVLSAGLLLAFPAANECLIRWIEGQ